MAIKKTDLTISDVTSAARRQELIDSYCRDIPANRGIGHLPLLVSDSDNTQEFRSDNLIHVISNNSDHYYVTQSELDEALYNR